MQTGNTRRRMLIALAALGGGAGLARIRHVAPSDGPDQGSLGALLSHGDSARRIGAVYLEDHPEEANAEFLRQTIAGSPAEAARLFEYMGPDELAAWVWSRQREDFRGHRTVVVDGWTLSQTEARLCALLSLD